LAGLRTESLFEGLLLKRDPDEDPDAYACDGCSRTGAPLLEAADGRALCLACVETASDLAGVEPQAIEMLRTLSRIVRKLD